MCPPGCPPALSWCVALWVCSRAHGGTPSLPLAGSSFVAQLRMSLHITSPARFVTAPLDRRGRARPPPPAGAPAQRPHLQQRNGVVTEGQVMRQSAGFGPGYIALPFGVWS